MIISTGYIEHNNIRAYLGVISASYVTGISFARDAIAAFKDFTGGRVTGYEESMQLANSEAIAALAKNAAALNADAVMGIQISSAVFSPHAKGTVVGIIAYGTAVKLKQPGTNHIDHTERDRDPVDSDIEPVRTHTIPTGAGFEWGR